MSIPGVRQEVVDRVLARRGHLHLFDRLRPRSTALVVIDMQGTFCEPGAPAEVAAARGICPAINRMAAGLRDLGGTVIWCTHANVRTAAGSDWPMFFDHFVASEVRTRTLAALSPGDPGQRIWRDLNVEPGDLHLVKNRYSALIPGSSALERVLRGGGIDTVAIAGTKTNVCCESTARDAMMLDFRVVLLADATAALSPGEHSSALENVIQQFGDVLTVDQALERMR